MPVASCPSFCPSVLRRWICLVVVGSLIPTVQAAEKKKTAKDFDTDKNGRLNFDEFVRYQIAVRDPKFSELDTNNDGDISATEKQNWAEFYWWDVEPAAASDGVTLETAATTVPKPETKIWSLGRFRLRKDHDALLKDKLEKADPANIAFYRDNLTSEDTWAVEGALGAVFDLYDAKKNTAQIGNYLLDQVRFVPSVTVNRITGTGPGNLEVTDSVVFRTGAAVLLQSADMTKSLWDYQMFTAAYRHSGAMDKGTFASSGEVEWEPMRNRKEDLLSIDGPEQPPSFWPNAPFFYRFTPTARMEFGDPVATTDAGHFLKVGAKLALSIKPRAFEQLEFFASYGYLWELANESADFDLFEIGARLALDPNKQFFLEAKYRLGQVPVKYTDIDLFQVSIATKF
jgi:hypothetical protein